MNDREYCLNTANIIMGQMKANRLRAMIGARDFCSMRTPGLQFKFSGCRKANVCEVIYNAGNDNYTMTFGKIVKFNYTPNVATFNGLYFDALVTTLEVFTGLACTL